MNKILTMKENIDFTDQFLYKNDYLNTCLKDCVDCCRDYFYASQPEFYLTLDNLLNLPVNLDYFYNKAKVTYDFFEYYLPSELKRLNPLTSGLLLANIGEDFTLGENINYQNLPDCIMLNNRRCSVYNSRPNTCRLYGTVNVCEYLNNPDYTNDDFTNYHLLPLVSNTQLIYKDQFQLDVKKYPLWFYYYYFMQPAFRPYVLKNLKAFKTLSEANYIDYIKSKY